MLHNDISGHCVSRPSPESLLSGDNLGGYGRVPMRVVGVVVFEVRRRWLAGGTLSIMTPRRRLGGGTLTRRLGGWEVFDQRVCPACRCR
jgi:hypothetical protein